MKPLLEDFSDCDMNGIMRDLLDCSMFVEYSTSVPLEPGNENIFKKRTIVGWTIDEHGSLLIGLRDGSEIKMVHYSRVPIVLGRIVKVQKERQQVSDAE
ncbi:MAG: hypothetical protein PHI12_10920 [Dehalococcoidales bacterium]|nr:hypothetical protein [Dehalococcoidales bacterium]